MAAINFPDSPTLNQEFSAGDRTWKWNGTVWVTVASTTIAPTPHAVSHEDGGTDELLLAQVQVSGLDTALAGKASTTHAATHASAGSDAITIAQSQVTNLTTDLAAKASLTGVQTLTNKTLTSPKFGGAAKELTVSGGAFAGYTFDVSAGAIQRCTTTATANGTVNFRSSSTETLSAIMSPLDSVTVVLTIANGATAYYPTAYQIDGTAVTPLWSGGTAPVSGNANATDVYTFTIIKTSAAPAYIVLAAQTKFA